MAHELRSLKDLNAALSDKVAFLEQSLAQTKETQEQQQSSNILKERDLIRTQYETMKLHLQQETKRAITLEADLAHTQQHLQALQK